MAKRKRPKRSQNICDSLLLGTRSLLPFLTMRVCFLIIAPAIHSDQADREASPPFSTLVVSRVAHANACRRTGRLTARLSQPQRTSSALVSLFLHVIHAKALCVTYRALLRGPHWPPMTDASSLPELVRSARLEASISGHITTHIRQTGDQGALIHEEWHRLHNVGHGGSGVVSLEQMTERCGTTSHFRAVKSMRLRGELNTGNHNGRRYIRELEALAKFSKPEVGHASEITGCG